MSGRIVEGEKERGEIVRGMRAVAVVGMKSEERADEPAFSIPQRVQSLGVRVIPVHPRLAAEGRVVLGETAYPDLESVPDSFDAVDVFRRPAAIPGLADEILALPPARRPKVVWLQSGIQHDEAARRLAEAGIDVVQDACLGVYAGRYRS